jgi:Ca2+-binding EF-hand superfamily protein
VPASAFLQSFLHGSLNLEAAAVVVPFDELDTNRDGRVSRQELLAYYRSCGFERARVTILPDQGRSAALTDILFRLLDTNHDGKLSMQELRGSAAALRRVDLNEDEWITPEELLLHQPMTAARQTLPRTREEIGFLPLEKNVLTDAQMRSVLAHYRGKQQLDAIAMRALLTRPPDLELIVRLGTLAKDNARVALANPIAGPMPPAERVRSTDEGLLVESGGLALEVLVGRADGSVRGLHAFYRQQFETADADKRGFLERKQLDDVPTLAVLFRLADRDADGKLTEAEFDAFLDLHALGAASFVTLTVADQSLGLFDLIDADRDGRLSLRELFTAWDRLRRYDRDGDGKLARDEFPRQLQARLVLGKAAPISAVNARPAPAPRKPRGPAWFQKLDRNGDGYVSRREFLGPEDLFRKLDTDGDGLISPEEAERLDVRLNRDLPK